MHQTPNDVVEEDEDEMTGSVREKSEKTRGKEKNDSHYLYRSTAPAYIHERTHLRTDDGRRMRANARGKKEKNGG